MEKKEEVFFDICNAVLKLEVQKGHLLWKISDVSRTSGVTRSLIYYYFGKEKEVILAEAWKFMLQLFFDNPVDGESRGIENRMSNILTYVKKMPYLFILFYLERGKDTEFGREIAEAEERLFNKLRKEFPDFDENNIKKIYMLELGSIVFGLDPSEVSNFLDFKKS